MFPFSLGDLRVDRVEEAGGLRVPVHLLLDALTPAHINERREAVPVGCYDFDTSEAILTLQGWIVRTGHHVVLIDSCAGNHKPRPGLPWIDQLDTRWLERLAAQGISPEQVDFVLCTHLHADHTGWNTRLLDGRWVPTFPNAKYVFGQREYDHWRAVAATDRDEVQRLVFFDSVLPCIEAGQAVLITDGFEIDGALRIEAAPGHTVGHAVVRAASGGKSGVFVGDVMHSPLQIVFPDTNHALCELPEQSRATRRRLLGEAADAGDLIIPAHFPAPFLGRIARSGDGFGFEAGV